MNSQKIKTNNQKIKNEQPENQNEQSNKSLCRCKCSHIERNTHEEDALIFKEMLTNMIVDESILSSTRRKKTSADDERTSSLTISIVGILFSSFVVGIVVLSDVSKVFRLYTISNNNEQSKLLILLDYEYFDELIFLYYIQIIQDGYIHVYEVDLFF